MSGRLRMLLISWGALGLVGVWFVLNHDSYGGIRPGTALDPLPFLAGLALMIAGMLWINKIADDIGKV